MIKNQISKKIDIEIYSDFAFTKHIRVLFWGRKIAEFTLEQGSTKINREERFVEHTRVMRKRIVADLGIPKPILSTATIGYKEVDVSTEEGQRVVKEADLLEVSVKECFVHGDKHVFNTRDRNGEFCVCGKKK